MEIVVSLSLLGLIVGLVLNIFPSSIVASHTASEQIEAENIAQSAIEELRTARFSSLVHMTDPEDRESSNPKYQVECVAFTPPGADADRTVGVRVTVRWESKKKQKELIREVWLSSVRS